MKGLVLGTDYIVESGSGAVKVLEVNTNARAVARGKFIENYDFSALESFIVSSAFTKVHVIHQSFNTVVAQSIEAICTNNNVAYESHLVNQNAITVPYIEDSDDVFIIRMSYDTTAIVDEEYAKDKFNLGRANAGSAIGPKTYFSGSDGTTLDELTTLPAFTYSGDSPNFIVKKRIPAYDKKLFPACYKFENNSQLNDFIANSLGEDELIQEFINSDLIDGKRHINRSINLVYGSDLTPINLGAYKVTHVVSEGIWSNSYSSGSWGKLDSKDRGKYITYYNSDDLRSRNYIFDESDLVLMADGSSLPFSSCSLGDSVKALDVPGLDLDDTNYDVETWTGSYSDTLVSSSLVDTSIIAKHSSPAINDYFMSVTLDDGNKWDDISSTMMLVKSGSNVVFKTIPNLEVGSEIVMYNVQADTVEVKAVTGLEVVFKEEQILGGMDVEPYDLFLPFVHNTYTLIQHNPCIQPQCGYNSCNPWSFFQGNRSCNTCAWTQCVK